VPKEGFKLIVLQALSGRGGGRGKYPARSGEILLLGIILSKFSGGFFNSYPPESSLLNKLLKSDHFCQEVRLAWNLVLKMLYQNFFGIAKVRSLLFASKDIEKFRVTIVQNSGLALEVFNSFLDGSTVCSCQLLCFPAVDSCFGHSDFLSGSRGENGGFIECR